MYVINPVDEQVIRMQAGGLSAAELIHFLDDGAREMQQRSVGAADVARRRALELLGTQHAAEAVAVLRDALASGGANRVERRDLLDLLTTALASAGDFEACAKNAVGETAARERDRPFVDIVIAGLTCANSGGSASWVASARAQLEPLARSAMASPVATRDDRFQLYEALIRSADLRGDREAGTRQARAWLDEIEALSAAGDDERTAIDVARVRAVTRLGTPERALAALAASERAMPDNYTASARLASVSLAAHRWNDAIAASRRGLAKTTGAAGRAGLLMTEASALVGNGDVEGAKALLVEAMTAARAIGHEQMRAAYVARAQHLLDDVTRGAPKRGG